MNTHSTPTSEPLSSRAVNESADRIYNFLKQQPIGTLATVDPNGDPHAAVIYYFIDQAFNITFATKSKTKKFDNLQHNNRAMLTVYESLSQTTVQITGTTSQIDDINESETVFRKMLEVSMQTSVSGMPPISKLYAGKYVALRLKPVQIRMAIFARPDPGGYDMYESVEFNP